MRKIIRRTYPAEFSIALLLLIFVLTYFLAQQIFTVPFHDLKLHKHVYTGMFLAAVAVLIMILIIWEEILFPINIKLVKGGMVFRNHRTKLLAQLVIYCCIPAIFVYLFLKFEVNTVRFFIWAAVCIVAPALEKIFSGITNYNDFLKLTTSEIEYKNNEKEGTFHVEDIQHLTMIKDEKNILHKIQLDLVNHDPVTIDLDEMELEAFYAHIDNYISIRYKDLLK
jgi:hypothetical protein